jgi:hypothetical protein
MEGIGDLAISWRIKGSSSIIFSQVKSIGFSCFYHISNVPPCGNMHSTHLHWKLLAPLHVLGFVPCMCLYMLCFLLALFWVINYVHVGLHTMYGCSCWAYCILFISCWLLWEIIGPSHFGGVICFALHNPKNVCTWGIPLSVDI